MTASERKRGRRGEEAPAPSISHSWAQPGASASKVTLEPGQVVYFEGRAELQCKGGAVWIQGTYVEDGASSVCLSAAAEAGGLLPIQALPSNTQVPRAPSRCTVIFGPPKDSEAERPLASGWSVHGEDRTQAALHIMPEWAEAASGISAAMQEACAGGGAAAVTAVCGSKGTGKSTFGRLLLNSLLNACNQVAWLETDCGQPEFTVPGLVSLTYIKQPVFGLPHMHPGLPARSHYIGHLSPEWDPQRYVASVTDLARWHAVHHGSVPLIVNTCGWIKGLGEDVLADVLRCSRPSHVVTLRTPNVRRNLPGGQFWLAQGGDIGPLAVPAAAAQAAVIQLPAVTSDGPIGSIKAGPKKLTANQARSLSWLNFARGCCGLPVHRFSWATEVAAETAEALTRARPYTVGFDSVRLQCLHTSVPEHLMGAVLNGALVGLCKEADDIAECLGVALVRAVDAEAGLLYVLSPLPLSSLQHVNLVQVGRLDLPPELLQSGEIVCPYLSSWSLSTVGTGAGAIKSRNNLQRAAQLAA
ncbi:g4760 [Coccomyxa viridis]|uniref:G4760 protein n=1 Tax=Coccomyxa viridis TaxID=1274662 RepID=A0ABP1FSJ8_9CHLO